MEASKEFKLAWRKQRDNIKVPEKDAKNPHFRSDYRSWEVTEKALKDAGVKKGRKRAVKLHDDERDAHGHADALSTGHSVEFRKGVSTRCEKYCAVAMFCPQYQQEFKLT